MQVRSLDELWNELKELYGGDFYGRGNDLRIHLNKNGFKINCRIHYVEERNDYGFKLKFYDSVTGSTLEETLKNVIDEIKGAKAVFYEELLDNEN